MKNNFELGVMYDTLIFFKIFFNYDEFIQDLQDCNYDIKEGLKYYKRVKKNIEISPQLQAFFDLNSNEISLLVNLFLSKIDKIKTINDCILLLNDKELILSILIDYYFESIKLQEKEDMIKNHAYDTTVQKILNLDIRSNTKASLVLIFTNYDKVIEHLVDSIYQIFKSIDYLHMINRKFISEFVINENYLNKLKDIVKIYSLDNAIYCISLLHSYNYKINKIEDSTFLILGNLYEEVLDKQYTFINVTFESMCNTLNNKLNKEILSIINKQKKVSTSDIIDLLTDYSRSAIYRAVTNLHTEKAIKIIDTINGKFYYSINSDYLENAYIVFKNDLKYNYS